MPHLVHGHVRFTADDFLLTDYQEKVLNLYKEHTAAALLDRLQTDSEQLTLMKDPVIVEQFNTTQNFKRLLANSLTVITALAEREGYTLTELLR
jgi:fumarate hydratase class II